MGLMSTIFGETGGPRHTDDYIELNADNVAEGDAGAEMHLHIAKIGDKTDVIDIKDAVYDGDVVVAEITRHSTSDRTMEHIIDELKQVAKEVDGDIVQKDEDQLIIAPTGVRISRAQLGG